LSSFSSMFWSCYVNFCITSMKSLGSYCTAAFTILLK
jgi:hypothetical protein